MRYRCRGCEVDFDLAEEGELRCPACLRKSTVEPADEAHADGDPSEVSIARRLTVSVLALLLVFVAIGMSWLALRQLVLAVASTRVRGEVVDARLHQSRILTCDVRYRYVVEGQAHDGSAQTLPPCPARDVEVRVSSLRPGLSDLGPGLGLLAFLVAPLTLGVGFAASVVALQLWRPHDARLRRLALRLGSRYGRDR